MRIWFGRNSFEKEITRNKMKRKGLVFRRVLLELWGDLGEFEIIEREYESSSFYEQLNWRIRFREWVEGTEKYKKLNNNPYTHLYISLNNKRVNCFLHSPAFI